MEPKTKFETDLLAFFPEIAKLNMYAGFDPRLWEVIYAIYSFYESHAYGEITIKFQDGRINHAYKMESIDK